MEKAAVLRNAGLRLLRLKSGLLAEISSLAAVRAVLLPRQRALAHGGAVAVGRDCGTVVFPGAPVKIYLEAPRTVR